MKLSEYAKKIGVTYKTAWNHYQAGLIPNARKLPSGIIVIFEDESKDVHYKTAAYSRVSSSENRPNLLSQSKRVQDFCAAKGWVVSEVIEECASGLNDERPKLKKILTDKSINRIVVEHKDRLTRFGFHYIQYLWDGEIIVINDVQKNKELPLGTNEQIEAAYRAECGDPANSRFQSYFEMRNFIVAQREKRKAA